MAPMFWGYANEDGTVSQTLIDHYREIALGGVGMIVVANAVIDESGAMASRVLRIDEDRFIKGLTELAKAIKSSGVLYITS
jgi:2,4-dienoyl-CoA reductase (NADPH2)